MKLPEKQSLKFIWEIDKINFKGELWRAFAGVYYKQAGGYYKQALLFVEEK